MTFITPQLLLVLTTTVFTSAILLHLTKKNSSAVFYYVIQSAAISSLLVIASFERISILLLISISATVAVKLFIAPFFFFRLIKRHQLKFTVSTYLNTPLSLAAIAVLIALVQADFIKPLLLLTTSGQTFILNLSLSTILISLFLIINRKGALSQMLGILSLENGIVSFALSAGLEQSPGLQLGITFNIFVWIIIATVFSSMIFRKFGSMDVTALNRLTE
jgi:hydrogenase-4 membrane subunit HyfE